MALEGASFLAKIWGDQPGWVFLPYRTGDGSWVEGEAIAWAGDATDLPPLGDVPRYFCPLVFDSPHRRARYALTTSWLWSDLDLADPRHISPRPSVAWETSPSRFQGLWLLDQPIAATHAADLSRRIAYAVGADRGGWDVTQVLRVPGTVNHKYPGRPRVTTMWAKRLIHTTTDIKQRFAAVCLPVPRTSVDWPNVTEADIECALASLPNGIRYHMRRSTAGYDRSLELMKLARILLGFGVEPGMAAVLLGRSSFGEKYRGRNDEQERLLATVRDAS